MQDYISVKETVYKLFSYADNHNWYELEHEILASNVQLDYSSYGGEVAIKSGRTIAREWEAFFTKMDHTHHQCGNEIINIENNSAKVTVYVTGGHYKVNHSNNNTWTNYGYYELSLKKAEGWRIDGIKYIFKYEEGNTQIPKLN